MKSPNSFDDRSLENAYAQKRLAYRDQNQQRKTSADLVPKLDLSKTAQFLNLPDPYAYLREEGPLEMKDTELAKPLSQEVLIEQSQV